MMERNIDKPTRRRVKYRSMSAELADVRRRAKAEWQSRRRVERQRAEWNRNSSGVSNKEVNN